MQVYIDKLHMQLEEARNEKGRPPTYKALRQNVRFLTDANEQLNKMAESARTEATNLRHKVNRLQRELDEAKNANGVAKPVFSDHAQPSIDPEMLSRLIRLCHPDRHENSQAANKATAWLLSQRQK